MESLVTWFTSTLGAHISREAVVFIISLFPILELRRGAAFWHHRYLILRCGKES